MAEALNRRRLLAGTAMALSGSAAAVPALASVTGPERPDPALALRPAWQAAREAHDGHFARMSAAFDRYEEIRPSVPEALFPRPDDRFPSTMAASGSANLPKGDGRLYYCRWAVDRMREHVGLAASPLGWSPAQRQRAAEIVRTWDAYDAADEAALAAVGYEEDTPEEDALSERMAEVTRAVAHAPAVTLAGLIFKAEVAAHVSDPAGDTLLGRAEEAFADGYEMSDVGVGRGIILDLLRLAAATAP